VADLASVRDRLAKCVRLFGSTERANARVMTERALASVGATWTDLGDWIENSYSEDELREVVEVIRKEERARMPPPPQSNGHITLPEPLEMAQFCHDRSQQLKDDNQPDFVANTYRKIRFGRGLKRGELGFLVSLYIKLDGRIT
jgi:hypothetical protein